MSLKWCALTGALMLGFVYLTYQHKAVSTDPPGVKTRWWDGTLASKETVRPDGSVENRTEYGDDGKTVVSFREWNSEGVIWHSKMRQKDGRVEEKHFADDGKTIRRYTLWNGDEKTFFIRREYGYNGKMNSETIMTEDGLVVQEERNFNDDGTLFLERKVLDNADQETKIFSRDGKVARRSLFKGSGDLWEERYHANGKVAERTKMIRLDGSSETEAFTEEGKLLWTRAVEKPGKKRMILTVWDGDKVKLRKFTNLNTYTLETVEEYSRETGKVTRRIWLAGDNQPTKVEKFRADGTLEKVLTIDPTKENFPVTKTVEYDETGSKVTSEKEGGEPEKFDRGILSDGFAYVIQGVD